MENVRENAPNSRGDKISRDFIGRKGVWPENSVSTSF